VLHHQGQGLIRTDYLVGGAADESTATGRIPRPRRAETPAVSRLYKQKRSSACAPPRLKVLFFRPVEKNVEQTTGSG
jgi:hypothetical protein